MRGLALLVVVAPVVATAAPKPEPQPVWIGTFQPTEPTKPCGDCKTAKVVPRAGAVRVLAPSEGAELGVGDVIVVSPLLGVVAPGRYEAGKIAIAWFNYDLRDGNDGVLVLPPTTKPRLIEPTAAELVAIKAALLRDDVLSGVKKALVGIEVGAIDVDGDGKADLAVTYGCNAWADGSCQSQGQFFVARRGAKWVEID